MSEVSEPQKEVTSEGQALLRKLLESYTQEDIASVIGCTRPNVSYWVNGKSLPGASARKVLHARYGIPPGAWNKRVGGQANAAANREDMDLIAGTPTIDLLNARIAKYASMGNDEDASPEIVLRAGELERKCIETRRALERDARAREADIVARSPEWADIKRRLMAVLTLHPAAMKDVVEALGRLVTEQAPAPTEEEIEE